MPGGPRSYLRVAFLLLAGVVLNLLLAWTSALVSKPRYDSVITGWVGEQAWARANISRQDATCLSIDGRSAVVRWQALYEFPAQQPRPADGWGDEFRDALGTAPFPGELRDQIDAIFWQPNVERVAAGWPFAALEYRLVRRTRYPVGHCGVGTWAELVEEHGRHGLRFTWGGWIIEGDLPLRVIWPGLVMNTLLHGTVLWLALFGPFAVRRLVRRWRDLCPSCNYPIGPSLVCTECGKPVPTSPWPDRSRHLTGRALRGGLLQPSRMSSV